MPTIGTLSDYLENKIINHLLRNTAFSPPATVWVALYTISPGETKVGVEVSGNGYLRRQGTFTISGNTAVNTAKISFPQALGYWGTIVAVSIMDAATNGNILFWGDITNHLTIGAGENYSINAGMLTVELTGGTKGGWGDGVPAQILNLTLNNTGFSSPGTSVYVALGNSLVTDADHTFVSWTEISTGGGTGYSRKQVTSWYAPTTGSTCNLADVVFSSPPIAATWGAITHIVIFNNTTSGDALLWGGLTSPVYIIAGDGFKFAAGNIDITLN